MSQRPPFLCCTSLDDSPTVHPSVFRHAQGNRDVQEHQAFVPLYYWDPIQMWHKTWHRQERKRARERADLKWMNSPFEKLSGILSSFFIPVFPDMERSKLKETPLQGFSSLCCQS